MCDCIKESDTTLNCLQYQCDRCQCHWSGKDGILFRSMTFKSYNPLQWCRRCLSEMNKVEEPALTLLKSKVGNFDSATNNCFICGKEKCISKYHVIKHLKICMTCVAKQKCLCTQCQLPNVEPKFINSLRIEWFIWCNKFEKKRDVYPTVTHNLDHFTKRNSTQSEEETYLQYTSLEMNKSSRAAFNVYGVKCTHADLQELLEGSGHPRPYLKTTVVKMFFLLLNERLKDSSTMCYFLQTALDMKGNLQRLFKDTDDGIFVYEYFNYCGVHENVWSSVLVVKKDQFKYELITFLPSAEFGDSNSSLEACKEANLAITEEVESAMKDQFVLLRNQFNSESPWEWNKLVFERKTIEEEVDIQDFNIEDAGIYTIMKTYLYLCYRDQMSITKHDLYKFRRLLLFMIITMDINYGQVKMTNDDTPKQTFLKH